MPLQRGNKRKMHGVFNSVLSGGGGGGVPSNPITDTSGLVMWLDGSDPGDSPATQWQDKSGNAYHWNVSGSMPAFVDNAAYFPGSPLKSVSDGGRLNSISATLHESEVFIRVQALDLNAAYAERRNAIFWLSTNTGGQHWPWTEGVNQRDVSDGRVEVGYACGGRDTADPGYTRLGAAIDNYMTINMDYSVSNGNRMRCRYDAVQYYTISGQTFGFPATCYLGRSNVTWSYFSGNIKQFILYNRILDAGERADIHAHLETL